LKGLTPEQLAFLEQYGFDADLFETWQKAVASGAMAKARNAVQGPILAPPPGTIKQLPGSTTKAHRELVKTGTEAIRKGQLGVVILNGGMATRFGGVVKGIVDVLGRGRSFLALAMADVHRAQERIGGRIPVYLMNSFATDTTTRRHFAKHHHFGLDPAQIHYFTQFVSIRMDQKGEILRVPEPKADKEAAAPKGGTAPKGGGNRPPLGDLSPYGPGHGDFAGAFRKSGLLQQFLGAGGRYLLVRNVDNLGARVSTAILGSHVKAEVEVTVELAPKWPEDVGGSPFLVDGRVQLVEQVRYPADFDPNIVDVFNTNTFWFTAPSLDRDFELGRYYVEKEVAEQKAVQIEHLIGELTRFLTTNWLQVRRSGKDTRFLPVKTPEDLDSARDEIREMYDDEAADA
jgi:UTP--glucose-1-phosphate uridylyltransferase